MTSDLRVATDRRRHYTYPDIVVACDPLEFADEHQDTITNPIAIVEVLSESTEKYDRGAKFERYRAIPTLAEYMLVAQDRVHVELYTRQAEPGFCASGTIPPPRSISRRCNAVSRSPRYTPR